MSSKAVQCCAKKENLASVTNGPPLRYNLFSFERPGIMVWKSRLLFWAIRHNNKIDQCLVYSFGRNKGRVNYYFKL